MRHHRFFPNGMPVEERIDIMTGFVRRVRDALDGGSEAGRRRYLSLRIPPKVAALAELGLDLGRLRTSGVDIFVVSSFFFTNQDVDFEELRARAPYAQLYLEMTHTTSVGPRLDDNEWYDSFKYIRTTPEQFYTSAHLAYAHGFDGVSLFNFEYFRAHGEFLDLRGPFHEPPFEIIRNFRNPEFLRQQPQNYFLGSFWQFGPLQPPSSITAYRGKPVRLDMEMSRPKGGWGRRGKLRMLAANDPARPLRWSVRFNDKLLNPTLDLSDPYGHAYDSLTSLDGELHAWDVPAQIVRSGRNEIVATLEEGDEAKILFLECSLSPSRYFDPSSKTLLSLRHFEDYGRVRKNDMLSIQGAEHGVKLRASENNPMLIFPEISYPGGTFPVVRVEVTSPVDTFFELYYTETEGEKFSLERRLIRRVRAGRNDLYYALAAHPVLLRLDPGNVSADFLVHGIEVRAVQE